MRRLADNGVSNARKTPERSDLTNPGSACPCRHLPASLHGCAESGAFRRHPFSAVFGLSRLCKPEVTGSIPVRSMAWSSHFRAIEGPSDISGLPVWSDLVRSESAAERSIQPVRNVVRAARLLELVRVDVERDRGSRVAHLASDANRIESLPNEVASVRFVFAISHASGDPGATLARALAEVA